jgi:hypothetical protein
MQKLLSRIPIFVLLLSGFSAAQDFTIIALPDTQYEAQKFPQVMASQTKWIVANQKTLNITAVLGEGDVVDNGSDVAQLQNADAAYRLLDHAGIPYFAAIGNHDYNGVNPGARNATGFNQWFGPARYAGHAYYRGHFPSGSNENFYGIVTMGGKQYLVLALEYMPRSAALAWGEMILNANADKDAILITHTYLYVDNTRVDRCDPHDMSAGNATGEDIWALMRKHANLVLVVSGHLVNGQVARRSDIADHGNLVNQIFTNYQTFPDGGDGWLRIITVHPSSNTVTVQTYSPWLKQYKTDSANHYTLYFRNPHLQSGKGTLSGRVRSNSCSVIAGAKVSAGGHTTLTGSDGRYTLSLPPGTYTVTVTHSGWTTATKSETVHDSFDTDLNFYLTPP